MGQKHNKKIMNIGQGWHEGGTDHRIMKEERKKDHKKNQNVQSLYGIIK